MVGNDATLKQLILREFHDNFVGGHFRIEVIKKRIKDNFIVRD